MSVYLMPVEVGLIPAADYDSRAMELDLESFLESTWFEVEGHWLDLKLNQKKVKGKFLLWFGE